MTKTGFISIRSKILLVLSAVLVSAVGLYLYLASQLFFEDKKLLVYELNQTNVRTLGEEVETYFKRVLDKVQMLSSLHAQGGGILPQVLPQLVDENEGILRIALMTTTDGQEWKTEVLGTWTKALELDGKDAGYLDQLHQNYPIPVSKVADGNVWIKNVTTPAAEGTDSTAVITIASRINAQRIAYADVKLDHVLSVFNRGGLARTYLMDSDGFSLADSQVKNQTTPADLKKDPLMEAAQASKVRSELKSFNEGNVAYLGSFYRLGLAGLVVASKIQAGEAFEAAQVLMRKSLLYALIVVTVAFLIALFLSHSLTTPIRRLVEATQRIAQGDFSVALPSKTGDELALLSDSFNSMTVNLKESREQIEEYSRTLEKKVAERTVKLEEQNVAIKEAQEALIRTTRLASVGEIAGRAAHEVLNPLTNISTRIEKLQGQLKKDEQQDLELFSEIISAWRKDLTEGGQEGLIKALSAPSQQPGKTLLEEDLENLASIAADFSKRGSGRQADLDFLMKESQRINKIVNGMRQLTRVTGAKKPIPVNRVVEDAVATMRDVLSKHKITVETKLASENPSIVADSDEMLQIFSNLMRNSMQAIGSMENKTREFKITLSTGVHSENGLKTVQIRVADNGPGIPQEHQGMIFEPSFTTKSAEEGTGLGLAICRRFVRSYEGEIVLEKSSAEGTTFRIDLPDSTQVNAGGNHE